VKLTLAERQVLTEVDGMTRELDFWDDPDEPSFRQSRRAWTSLVNKLLKQKTVSKSKKVGGDR
jgi:hypothetical protein